MGFKLNFSKVTDVQLVSLNQTLAFRNNSLKTASLKLPNYQEVSLRQVSILELFPSFAAQIFYFPMFPSVGILSIHGRRAQNVVSRASVHAALDNLSCAIQIEWADLNIILGYL